MGSEFNLSDKIWNAGDRLVREEVISIENVKKFIKLLKEEYMKYRDSFKTLEDYYRIFDDMDKLAGEELK